MNEISGWRRISVEGEEPRVEIFTYEGCEVHLTRTLCSDKMGGNVSVYGDYDYETFDFKEGSAVLQADVTRCDIGPQEAFLRTMNVGGRSRSLAKADLATPLARAAQAYFRGLVGKVLWNDPSIGYSPVPELPS